MGTTNQRELAIHAAANDFGKALTLARRTQKLSFRCQALAWVARFAPDSEVVKIAEEALAVAFSAEDPDQTVGAAAWPVRALLERGQTQRAIGWLPKLLNVSGGIVHPDSRLTALYLLWQAVYSAGGSAEKQVRNKLIAACLSADSWQAGMTMREIVLVVAPTSDNEANRVLDSMPEGRYKRSAQRRLAEGRPGFVRAFFWESGQGIAPALFEGKGESDE